jgi:rod shape-determining protein MreB
MEIEAKIFENRIVLTAKGKTITALPVQPFTTTRLLVGTFMPAVDCMKDGFAKVGATGFFKKKPKLKIYPQTKTEGGLSEVEKATLLEVGYSAGARKVEVHV